MAESVKIIDDRIKDELLRFPTAELIRRLFPDVRFYGRSVLCNPLRDDRHPSLSCFRDRHGFQMWKDHATGEFGDNIDFFRKANPSLGYVDAVDALSRLVLGKSVLQEGVPGTKFPPASPRGVALRKHRAPVEEKSALRIVSAAPFDAGKAPEGLVSYVRGRGISDEVAARYLEHVIYINSNREGRSIIDPLSGLPAVDGSGEILRDQARFDAVAMRNDVGGYTLRVPGDGSSGGFKVSNVPALITILAGGNRPSRKVSFFGEGDGAVGYPVYDASREILFINPVQGFAGVKEWAAGAGAAFVDSWRGRYLEGRDIMRVAAVLTSLNGPLCAEVDVVEGMFDAVSDIEFEKMAGRGAVPGRDLVVLNSVGMIRWAVPFLSLHGKIHSLLDNDVSGAGKKAFESLCEGVAEFGGRIGTRSVVLSDSSLFYPCKDINDFLRRSKGFSENPSVAKAPKKDKKKVTKNNQVKP